MLLLTLFGLPQQDAYTSAIVMPTEIALLRSQALVLGRVTGTDAVAILLVVSGALWRVFA